MIRLSGILALLILAPAVSAIAQQSVSPNCFAVQVGAFETSAEAGSLAEALQAEGYDPVWVFAGSRELHRVLLGKLEYELDAQLLRENLRQSGAIPDAFVQELATVAPLPLDEQILPFNPVFQLEVESAAQMAITSLHGVPEYERLEAIDDRGDDASYRDELLLEVQRRSTADPLYGYIQTNLGIMDLVDGNWEAALTRFWPVANGNVASAAAHRVMAMIRIAWILHHQGQRLRAYQAYREIEQFTGSDAVRARCQVECIGLMMELAESGRGTHAQMRTAAARVLSSISDDFVQPRATIELMVLESHARQASPDYDRALELGEAFLANCQDRMIDHPELAREVGSALHQMGRWQLEMGRLEQAREMYERCLREFPASAERFAGSHPHAQSMIGLAVIAADLGDRGTHDQILRDLFEIFPEDRSVQQFRQVQPRIERDYAPSPGVERGDWSSSETLTRELQ